MLSVTRELGDTVWYNHLGDTQTIEKWSYSTIVIVCNIVEYKAIAEMSLDTTLNVVIHSPVVETDMQTPVLPSKNTTFNVVTYTFRLL